MGDSRRHSPRTVRPGLYRSLQSSPPRWSHRGRLVGDTFAATKPFLGASPRSLPRKITNAHDIRLSVAVDCALSPGDTVPAMLGDVAYASPLVTFGWRFVSTVART